jgi:hypothetical protein
LKRNVIAVKHTKITKELKRDIYLFAMIVCRSKMAGNVLRLAVRAGFKAQKLN